MQLFIWFWLVAIMLTGYVVLDGFDLGAGVLHLLIAKTDRERRLVLRAVGPVWDGNEVWLVAGGGTLFFAFPLLYASAFSGFYLPLMMVLWLLILRGIGIELRTHMDSAVWRGFFDGCFAFASTLLAVFFGAAVSASRDAAVPAAAPPLKLVARAEIGGKEVVREAAGGTPRVEEAGDLVTTTEQDTVTLRPGGQAQLTVKIERRNGHAGRVPLEVRGLPHGVRVLDIGLNGILITERETTRTIVIYSDPTVAPMEHPFVVLSRSERKGTEHAAKSVLLRVVPRD